jgi:heterodisulfide reductase subunit C
MPAQTLPVVGNPRAAIGKGIDYELFLDCVHCGLCTASCPTYVELGTEMDSPRGRIYLMRGVVDGRIPLDNDVKKHLDLCLNCRACETACPSGVQYGKLIEPFRIDLVKNKLDKQTLPWWQRFIVFSIFPYAWRSRLALGPAKLLQWLHLDKAMLKIMPRRMRQMQEILPKTTITSSDPRIPARGRHEASNGWFTHRMHQRCRPASGKLGHCQGTPEERLRCLDTSISRLLRRSPSACRSGSTSHQHG